MNTIRTLLIKQVRNELTPGENQALQSWVDHSDQNRALYDKLMNQPIMAELLARMDNFNEGKAWTYLNANKVTPLFEQKTTSPVHRVHFLRRAWVKYAAVLLLIAGTATLLYNELHKTPAVLGGTQYGGKENPDIQPGGNKAVLTLADGSTIVLDSAANGSLAQQGSTNIIKLDAGSLAYKQGKLSGEIGYNTITTPKGGQYQITLTDGTKVWLNAASSIRFPMAFDKNRKVAITGEAYLEVAKDKVRPFAVTANNTEVLVLGTSFNINAYEDEDAVITTLIEGGVKVTHHSEASSGSEKKMLKQAQHGEGVVLRPGQQSAVAGGRISIRADVNTNEVMAWKNGAFNFNNIDFESAMKQLARWYDIEIQYDGPIPAGTSGGEIDRNLTLLQVLKGMDGIVAHFKLEGKTLHILP